MFYFKIFSSFSGGDTSCTTCLLPSGPFGPEASQRPLASYALDPSWLLPRETISLHPDGLCTLGSLQSRTHMLHLKLPKRSPDHTGPVIYRPCPPLHTAHRSMVQWMWTGGRADTRHTQQMHILYVYIFIYILLLYIWVLCGRRVSFRRTLAGV